MRYEAPETLERASQLLAAETGIARVLAGGTDLLVQIKSDVIDPILVVDIKRSPKPAKSTRQPADFALVRPSPAPN